MKKLENLKKAELIKLITEIRPKADAYDRVCKSVGIENNLLGFIKNLNIQNVSSAVCTYRNHFADIEDYGNCRRCGAGFSKM